jgi:hypothetical protein
MISPTLTLARGSKVHTPTPPLDDDSESNFDFEKMITSFGKKAIKKIMFLMKEIENREGTLEVQEELFRLEREKTIAFENALVIEKKGFNVQEDLLKEKEIEIISLKKSLAKDELIVDELTRESFLAKASFVSTGSIPIGMDKYNKKIMIVTIRDPVLFRVEN